MFRFNVRVYGVLLNELGEVLVSDEKIRGKHYTKFPGGGLEFGEGTRDCLVREFMEELALKIEVQEHLYTTDYFQVSAFNPDHQIISIYYKVKALEPIAARISTEPFQFDEAHLNTYEANNETESLRLIPLEQLTDEMVTLPIDKLVVRLFNHKEK